MPFLQETYISHFFVQSTEEPCYSTRSVYSLNVPL